MKSESKKMFVNSRVECIFCLCISLAISFCALIASPMHIWNKGMVWGDSSVFRTVAMMMEKGYVPYRDTFDHKGPVLYFLNYWGDLISRDWGVWFIECICLSGFLVATYFEARLLLSRLGAAVISLLTLVPFLKFFDGGNITEEYSLMFVAVSLYIFTDYFLNDRITNLRLIICGFCCAIVLLLRPNLVAPWAAMCLMVLCFSVWEKKYSDILRFVLWFLIGMMIAIVPFLVYLAINGALDDFWNCYFVFNMAYTSGRSDLMGKVSAFWGFLKEPIYFLSMLISIVLVIFKRKKSDYANLIFVFVLTLFISMGGQVRPSYSTALIPIVVYPAARVLAEIKSRKIIYSLTLVILFVGVVASPMISVFKQTAAAYSTRNESKIDPEFSHIFEVVKENTTKDDKISVFGNYDFIYIYTDRVHATKYSYQQPIDDFGPEILNEYFDGLQNELPKIVISFDSAPQERMNDFLNQNNYVHIYEKSEFGGLRVYKNQTNF